MRHLLEPLRAALAAAALLLAAAVPRPALAQVEAELVAVTPTVAPGGTAQLALRLNQQPPWHTFWGIYPGIGLPTELAWQLPSGWVAEAIEWPTPQVLRDARGKTIGHGYTGDVLLPVKVHVPGDAPVGASVPVAARASWLMCHDTRCVIGRQSVGTTLRVAATAGPADAVQSAALAQMPMPKVPDASWRLAASLQGRAYTLHLLPPAGVREMHFFPADRGVPYAPRQLLQAVGGSLTLRLPAMPAAAGTDPPPTRLRGVLGYHDLNTQQRQGLVIDLPLQPPPVAAQAVGGYESGAAWAPAEAATLALAWAAGLLLNLMPGVLPLLGWHLPRLWQLAQPLPAARRRLAAYGAAYAAGVWAMAGALIAMLARLQAEGIETVWGLPQQSLAWLGVAALALLAVALHAALPARVGLPAWVPLPLRALAGGLLTAAAAAVAAGAAFKPALGLILMVPLGQAFAQLSAAALGLALPVLLLTLLPGLLTAIEPPARVRRVARVGLALTALAAAVALALRMAALAGWLR